jgi:hypothetical protein
VTTFLGVCRGEFFDYVDPRKPPVVRERLWTKWEFAYDDVLSAFLTLFAVQTGEGWPALVEIFLKLNVCNNYPIARAFDHHMTMIVDFEDVLN